MTGTARRARPPRELTTSGRLAQYALLVRLSAPVLATVVVTSRPGTAGSLLLVVGVLVVFNYYALRNWTAVVEDLRIAAKPHFPLLDGTLALLVLAYVGAGTPMVLYLIATTLLAGLIYRAWLTLTLGAALAGGYAVALWRGSGLVPAHLDFHTTVTLPALILLAGVAGIAARRLISAQERSLRELATLRGAAAVREERLRMARDLHDTVTKNLHGIRLLSRGLELDLDRGDLASAREVAAVIDSTAGQLTVEARRVIHDLRDPLDDGPFDDAVRAVVDRAARGHGLRATVRDDRPPGAPCPQATVRQELLSVISEAVHNTVKHAGAEHVQVVLGGAGPPGASPDGLEIIIRDDGRGFDSSDNGSPAGHFGLVGMAERAGRAGGRLRIDSSTEGGTTIVVDVPAGGVADPRPATHPVARVAEV